MSWIRINLVFLNVEAIINSMVVTFQSIDLPSLFWKYKSRTQRLSNKHKECQSPLDYFWNFETLPLFKVNHCIVNTILCISYNVGYTQYCISYILKQWRATATYMWNLVLSLITLSSYTNPDRKRRKIVLYCTNPSLSSGKWIWWQGCSLGMFQE